MLWHLGALTDLSIILKWTSKILVNFCNWIHVWVVSMKVLHIVACSKALNRSQICVIKGIKFQPGFLFEAQAQLLLYDLIFQIRTNVFWMHERNICKYSCK